MQDLKAKQASCLITRLPSNNVLLIVINDKLIRVLKTSQYPACINFYCLVEIKEGLNSSKLAVLTDLLWLAYLFQLQVRTMKFFCIRYSLLVFLQINTDRVAKNLKQTKRNNR